MSRSKFYRGKAKFLIQFIWWGEWELVRDEWNLTYEQRTDAHDRSDEICREAAERLLTAIEEKVPVRKESIQGVEYTVHNFKSILAKARGE